MVYLFSACGFPQARALTCVKAQIPFADNRQLTKPEKKTKEVAENRNRANGM